MSHYGYVSEQLLSGRLWPARRRGPAPGSAPSRLDVERVRSHFDFPRTGRVVTNNAATSQVPRELIELYGRIAPWYESVHRGQSAASRRMTAEFEESFDTIATWINAPSCRCLATVLRLELVWWVTLITSHGANVYCWPTAECRGTDRRSSIAPGFWSMVHGCRGWLGESW